MDRASWKRLILNVLAVFLILAGLSVTFVNLTTLRCFQLVGDVTCRVDTPKKLVAVTFSGGPSIEGVDALMPTLAAHDVKATFFLNGAEIEANPGLATRLRNAGHELGSQGYSYTELTDRPLDFYRGEIARTDALLRKAGVEMPHLFRPPYGSKSVGLVWELQKVGHRIIMWDVSDAGLNAAGSAAYASAMLSRIRPGSIVAMDAMSDNRGNARAALPLILDGLAEKGYRVVTVSELLAAGN